MPQFRGKKKKKKGIKHVCVSVSRDNGGGPLPLAFPPTGCTTDSGLSSVLNNAPPSAREQGSGDNPGTDRGMVFVGSDSGVKIYENAVQSRTVSNTCDVTPVSLCPAFSR